MKTLIFRDVLLIIPQNQLDNSPDQLYFRVEGFESFAWVQESLKSIEKRRRYKAWKIINGGGFLERESDG